MFFHALAFAGSRGSCLNTGSIDRVLKHLPRDPTSINAMKQTCVTVILAYSTLLQPNSHRNDVKTFKDPSSYTDFSKQNCVDSKLSNVIPPPQCHSLTQRFREQKHRRNDPSGPRCFLYIKTF